VNSVAVLWLAGWRILILILILMLVLRVGVGFFFGSMLTVDYSPRSIMRNQQRPVGVLFGLLSATWLMAHARAIRSCKS
jgi:hypothetical protein